MSKDPKTHSGDAQDEGANALRSVILLALPLISLQRNILGLVQRGIEQATLVKPVQNLLLAEIHAVMMILDPERKLRERLGVDFEEKIKELLDDITVKVSSGSLKLVEAQQTLADRLIEILKAVKDGQKRKRAARS